MNPSETIICQSCGTPLHHLADYGTNKDGTANTEYCHFCYCDGKFTDYGITLEQKIEKNISMAKKMGIPREEATILAHTTLPTLKRWKGLKPLNNYDDGFNQKRFDLLYSTDSHHSIVLIP